MSFSVIIPSRNRSELLRLAVQSVLAQSHAPFEVIVVNDGSDSEEEKKYRSLASEWSGKVKIVDLEKSPSGHGPSYAINRGVESASAKYVCFLDDDDSWTDPAHLERASENLAARDADLYFSNQNAYSGEQLVSDDLWLNPLGNHVGKSQATADTCAVTVESLMTICDGRFAHLNTMIVRKDLYEACAGMDEHIRYECEWDLYLRLISEANLILYNPTVIARHNVPDPTLSVNVSTGMPTLRKLLFRSTVLDKALMFSSDPLIRGMAMKHKIYTLKRIAELLVKEGKLEQALFFAREGRIKFWDVKWRLYIWFIASKAALGH